MRRMISILLGGLIVLAALPLLAQDAAFIPQPPLNVEIITPENASRLELLGTLGRGTIEDMLWSPNGETFVVKSSIGLWIYTDIHEEPFFIEGASYFAVFDEAWNTLAIPNHGGIDIWNLQTLETQAVTVETDEALDSRSPIFLSGDGSQLYYLVYGSSGYELRRWNVSENQLRDSLAINTSWVRDMSLSPRGDALLIDNNTGSELILLNDALESLSLYRPEGYQPAGMVFHPSEPVFAYFTYDNTETPITLFNYETGQDTATYSVSIPYASVTLFFSPQGDLMARAAHNYVGELYMWDLETGAVRTGSSEQNIDDPFQTHFNPDGRYLVIEGYNQSEIWDLETMQTIEPPWAGTYIRFNPDGTQVAVSDFGQVSLYSLQDDTLIREFTGRGAPFFNPTGDQLAFRDRSERSISIYPAAAEGEAVQVSGYGEYSTLGFSPEGGYLLTQTGLELALWEAPFSDSVSVTLPDAQIRTASGTDQSMRFSTFDFGSGRLQTWWIDETDGAFTVREGEIFDFSDELLDDPAGRMYYTTLDADEGLFVGAGGEDTEYYGGTPYLFLRDLVSGRYEYVYDHTGTINALALSPDGNTLATGSGYLTEGYMSEDRTLRLWDVSHIDGVARLTERARFDYSGIVMDVVFDTTGSLIAVDAWQEISVRDTLTGREIFQHDTYNTNDLTFSPDSRLLVTKTDNQLQVWNLETNVLLASLPANGWWSEIYFDPNGRWIATSDYNDVVRLYGVSEDS
jgi:WD40 repeat protein